MADKAKKEEVRTAVKGIDGWFFSDIPPGKEARAPKGNYYRIIMAFLELPDKPSCKEVTPPKNVDLNTAEAGLRDAAKKEKIPKDAKEWVYVHKLATEDGDYSLQLERYNILPS